MNHPDGTGGYIYFRLYFSFIMYHRAGKIASISHEFLIIDPLKTLQQSAENSAASASCNIAVFMIYLYKNLYGFGNAFLTHLVKNEQSSYYVFSAPANKLQT